MSALKPRCLDCRNCVNACPFVAPKYNSAMHLQMKCDMCYGRTSEGLKPMCERVPHGCALVRALRTDRPFQAHKAG
ncbi:MAG: 4Fe-4S dicluster domain-containing protein [Blastocatellia bacterium]